MSSGNWRPFCLGLNVLITINYIGANKALRHQQLATDCHVCLNDFDLCLKFKFISKTLHSTQSDPSMPYGEPMLTHWGWMTHICVGNLTTIGTNAGILLIGHLWTNFSDILIEIPTFSLKKIVLESVVCEKAAILSRTQCVKLPSNRKCQDYLYVKWEYWSTMYKIKHYLRHENKVNENKVSSYCETLRCETIKKKLFSLMSNSQTYYYFQLHFQKVDQHTGGKWLIHGTKRHKAINWKA